MTVVVRLFVTENVIRQFTHGVLPERLETPVWVASAVAVKVNEQSGGCWAARAAAAKSRRGTTLSSLVMPLIVRRKVSGWG